MSKQNSVKSACIALGFSLLTVAPLQAQNSIVGKATYYADAFHGRLTSSGEKFNMYAFTAAHRTLPFGTLLKVTNLKNKKVTVVRVNDRGPFGKGYIIDLSKAAARHLDMLRDGVIKVRLDILHTPEPQKEDTDSAVQSEADIKPEKFQPGLTYNYKAKPVQFAGKYAVQVGSFGQLFNALHKLQEVRKAGYEKVYVQVHSHEPGLLYKVVVGVYPSEAITRKNLIEIRNEGMDGFPVKHI